MITFERTPVPVPAFVPFETLTISLDADVNRAGQVVFVTRNVHGISIHFPHRGTTHRLSYIVQYPRVRWIGGSQALLFDGRSDGTRDNAWVINDDGATKSSFSIGDAVADVLANGSEIVVTYFDEGVFGDDPLSQNGIVAFTPSGEFLWGWNSSALADRLRIYDCYAAGFAGDDTALGAFLYSDYEKAPSYAFGLLDVGSRTVTLHAVPKSFHRTHALSSTQAGAWLFAVGPRDAPVVAAWRPGDANTAVAPSPIRLTRGLGRGRFLSISDRSVEIVTVTVRPAG